MGAFIIAAVLSKLRTGLRQDFHVHVDEAHNFGSLGMLLQESRKFGTSVSVITQFMQALDETTRAAIIGTTRTHAYFRLGVDDAVALAPSLDREFQQFNAHTLQHLDCGVTVVRRPGADATEVSVPAPTRGTGNPAAVIKQSRLHYGVRREVVECNITRALGFNDARLGPRHRRGK
jgi:hypothetical protein